MSKHKQPGGIWTAQYAHCALEINSTYALQQLHSNKCNATIALHNAYQ